MFCYSGSLKRSHPSFRAEREDASGKQEVSGAAPARHRRPALPDPCGPSVPCSGSKFALGRLPLFTAGGAVLVPKRKGPAMLLRRVSAVLIPLLLFAAGAAAQTIPNLPLSVEVRLGGAFPTGELAEEELGPGAEPGPAFAAGALFHVTPRVALFGSYQRAVFDCASCGGTGLLDELIDEGAGFGVQGSLPLPASPWVRLGGVYHELVFSATGADLASDAALGFQVGAGVTVPLLRGLRFVPGIFYRSYSADLNLGGLPSESVDVGVLLVDLGLAYRF